ncbi:MAG TPA: type II secretion system major pseudopilin GspG [Candidatus Thiothrix moscowensis]|uniref:type II secretion system major pseudopilin GspG n=1 Tax=unclassified Thiothrix TaxID=2636184 RepID=UPI001A31B5FA|nr:MULTISPECIES: type II secretion system major pseudopilin GspG [unclassified Thiothrix]MBJ6609591.1 type II secretion system major pseudopilin GspG [Candidatus Thiothrix moscowensis]HRJ51621.1 type II secretion system major pseudopilin GspG [Candidatus Thiothrix moscowensis]HRJ91936.1 type II secretion system major pseudopilin GspG [Candidatus Thiothrix moscowensis]
MQRKPRKQPLSGTQRGFSLIELMIVLVILGLIAGIVGPQAMKYLGKGKSQSAKVQIENISAALDMYRLEVGSYPSTADGLKALVAQPSSARGWNGPYLKKGEVPKDPWNNDYQYKRPGGNGQAYDLISMGADGAAGGEGEDADLSLWKQ